MPMPKYFALTKRYDENFLKTCLDAVRLNPGITAPEALEFVRAKVGPVISRGTVYNALEALLYLGKLRSEVSDPALKKGRPFKKYYIDQPIESWSDFLLKVKKPKQTIVNDDGKDIVKTPVLEAAE